jgi:hypothetical protein
MNPSPAAWTILPRRNAVAQTVLLRLRANLKSDVRGDEAEYVLPVDPARPRPAVSPSVRAPTAAMFNLGTKASYRGRLYSVVGVAPIGLVPCLVELEDAETGHIRSIETNRPELVIVRDRSSETSEEEHELESRPDVD